MSAVATGVCLLSVLSLCAVNVLSIAQCDQKIIDNLKTKSGCYEGGVPPNLEVSGDYKKYSSVSAQKHLEQQAICTISYYKNDGNSYVTWYRSPVHKPFYNKYVVKEDHILETDKSGTKYRLYIIHSIYDSMFSYYGCIESGAKGDGQPMLEVVENVTAIPEWLVRQAVEKARSCFEQLGAKGPEGMLKNICATVTFIPVDSYNQYVANYAP